MTKSWIDAKDSSIVRGLAVGPMGLMNLAHTSFEGRDTLAVALKGSKVNLGSAVHHDDHNTGGE